jgi:hypothetical protein
MFRRAAWAAILLISVISQSADARIVRLLLGNYGRK